MSINSSVKQTIESIDEFDNWFLKSKDLALQPINFLFESEPKLNRQKAKHLSIKNDRDYERCRSSKSKKSKKSKRSSQKSDNTHKSQKSTSNTNKKTNRKKGRDSIYNSNVVIVHYEDDDESSSSFDPIQKEVEKLKNLLLKKKIK